MKRLCLAIALFAAALAGCGGGGSSSSTPSTPTAPPSPLVVTYVSVPFAPSPYPTSANTIAFPGAGTPFAVVLQANGGTPGYNAALGAVCGTASASSATVAKLGSNQFTVTPTVAGGACPLTFTDSSQP